MLFILQGGKVPPRGRGTIREKTPLSRSTPQQSEKLAISTDVADIGSIVAFKEPLEEGDRVSIWANITTTKRHLVEEWECCEQVITIPQPVLFDSLRQGHTRQDISPIMYRVENPQFPEDNWEDAIEGIRAATLSATGLELRTGTWEGREHSYQDFFGFGLETTWDIDIQEIEVIRRT